MTTIQFSFNLIRNNDYEESKAVNYSYDKVDFQSIRKGLQTIKWNNLGNIADTKVRSEIQSVKIKSRNGDENKNNLLNYRLKT